MVWGTEGACRHQGDVLTQFPCYRIDLRCLKAFTEREGRKDAGQSLCHHRLSAPWGTNHQEVVTASCRDFECSLHGFLSLDLGEVKGLALYPSIEFSTCVDLDDGESRLSCQHPDDFAQGAGSMHLKLIDDGSLPSIGFGKNEAAVAFTTGLDGYG